jgi:hypothetical protein
MKNAAKKCNSIVIKLITVVFDYEWRIFEELSVQNIYAHFVMTAVTYKPLFLRKIPHCLNYFTLLCPPFTLNLSFGFASVVHMELHRTDKTSTNELRAGGIMWEWRHLLSNHSSAYPMCLATVNKTSCGLNSYTVYITWRLGFLKWSSCFFSLI